jgi:hypothetical protein
MKTESNGGTAETQVTQKLARLYEVELDRAERDFPTMRTPLWDLDEQHRPRRRMRLRLAAEAIGILAVAAIVVGGGWLAANPSGPSTPGAAALGPDGIPNQIDGESVLRVGDKVESGKQGGYLLGGYVFQEVAVNCPVDTVPQAPCFGLGPTAGSNAATGGVDVSEAHDVSDPNPFSLGSWLGAPIVARMKGCTQDNGMPCPPVVMAIVWPTVPTDINGEKVYRSTDQVTFSKLTRSFLLGGVFLKPDFVPPCPMPLDKTQAEQQLLPYCYIETIDGLQLSPNSSIDEPKGELVVVRAHVNDPIAADCPVGTHAQCKAAIVVESVVWRSGAAIQASPSFGAGGPSSTPLLNGAGSSLVAPPPPPLGAPLPSAT